MWFGSQTRHHHVRRWCRCRQRRNPGNTRRNWARPRHTQTRARCGILQMFSKAYGPRSVRRTQQEADPILALLFGTFSCFFPFNHHAIHELHPLLRQCLLSLLLAGKSLVAIHRFGTDPETTPEPAIRLNLDLELRHQISDLTEMIEGRDIVDGFRSADLHRLRCTVGRGSGGLLAR